MKGSISTPRPKRAAVRGRVRLSLLSGCRAVCKGCNAIARQFFALMRQAGNPVFEVVADFGVKGRRVLQLVALNSQPEQFSPASALTGCSTTTRIEVASLPLDYLGADEHGARRVVRGQCVALSDCRSGRALASALHGERSNTADVVRGLLMRTDDAHGLRRKEFFFERGTWAGAKILPSKAVSL